MDRLAGIDAKLTRAEQQIAWANQLIPTWTAREGAWTLEPEINEGERRFIYSWREGIPMPPLFPVICDEIIHHLRSSLDHLACHLIEACGGEITTASGWPIKRTQGQWKRDVERRQRFWQRWRKPGGGPLKGIPIGSPIWAFIEGKQPYNSGGKSSDDPLLALNDAWNANKHRILNEKFTRLFPEGDPIDLFDITPPIEPVEQRWLIEPHGRKVKDGTKIVLLRFPKDQPLPEVRVNVKAGLSGYVGVGDGKGPNLNFGTMAQMVRLIVLEAHNLL
jgi:hypothetical protein